MPNTNKLAASLLLTGFTRSRTALFIADASGGRELAWNSGRTLCERPGSERV